MPRDRPGDDGAAVFVPLVGQVLAARRRPAPTPTSCARRPRPTRRTTCRSRPSAPTHGQGRSARSSGSSPSAAPRWSAAGTPAASPTLIAAHPHEPTPAVRRTHADALRRLGDGAAARRSLGPLVQAADDSAREPHLATLLATALYTEGDLDAALEALDSVDADAVATDLAGVEWRACRVQVLSMLGRRDEAHALATETLRVAETAGDPQALAAAHLASSRTTTGARKEAHLEEALRAAIQTADVVTAALVLVNQSHLLLAAARYAEAAVAAREALRLAEMSSPTGRLSTALHNLAEALSFTGEYDEARWQLQRAVAHSRRLGPGRTASGLFGIAEIHRQLGHDEQAAAAYDEAIGLARRSGELQVLVPALAGLARLQVQQDADAAAATAAEAEGWPLRRCCRWLWSRSAGWPSAAARARRPPGIARRAAEDASSVQAFDLLAEALELVGVAADDPATSATRSARRCPSGATAAPRPRQPGSSCCSAGSRAADGVARSRARDAARLLQRLGVVGLDGRPVTEQHIPPR